MSKEINILLLGETGAGKSTTLNALASYLRFSTFKEALKSVADFTEVIPSQFTLPDSQTGKECLIKSGPVDANERHECSGNSVTRSPTAYRFTIGHHLLRIIDTPGAGDTGGTVEDKKNFEHILTYLQMHTNLHGILIIVKGNESRKTTFFKYCITELLTHFHRSVIENILFCFTFSQIIPGTFGPGQGYETLKSFLENDIKSVGIKLEPGKNAFFIENDAYRFLVAKKQGYPWNDLQEMIYSQSWSHSVKECKQLIGRILTLLPHNLTDTISLHNAQKIIVELSEPIVHLSRNIEQNIADIEEHEKELQNATSTKESLAKFLEFQVTDLEKHPSENPKMVCTASKCVDVINFEGEEKIHYRTVCCEPCNCFYFNNTLISDTATMFCAAMRPNVDLSTLETLLNPSVNCTVCGCNWSTHMSVRYDYVKVMRKLVDKDIERQLAEANGAIEQKNILIKMANEQIEELKQEKMQIEEIGSQFAYFLTANSMLTHNHYFDSYIDMLIDQENQKTYPKTEGLYRLKQEHKDKVSRLSDSINNRSHAEITVEDILRLQRQLLTLKHNGHIFRQILQTNEKMRSQFKRKEKNVLTLSGIENAFSKMLSQFLQTH